MDYLIRCPRCDRAFWLAGPVAPIPEHAPWERRATAHHQATGRCDGSARPGYWIGEGEGPRSSDTPPPS